MIILTPVVVDIEPRKPSGLDFNSLLLHIPYFPGSSIFSCVVVHELSPYWTGDKRAFNSLFAYGFVGDTFLVCCWLGIYNPGDRASAFKILEFL
jgi:hypothetical protein